MMARAQELIDRKRVPWSPGEDKRLVKYMQRHGESGRWKDVPRRAELMNRTPKSCRLRWTNYLKPDIKKWPFSKEEKAKIIKLQKQLGNKWVAIARNLPGRTDTGIKNFWKTCQKKQHLKKETPALVAQTPLHQPVAAADIFTCAVSDLGDEVPKLHSDASFTWNPLHGHGFHPTDEELLTSLPPLPPQIPSFDYQQAMDNNKIEIPNPTSGLVTQTPLHQLPDTADLLTCAVNDLRDGVPKLHSDASFTWNPWHGHGFHATDEELLNSLPPQTPIFNYQQAMENNKIEIPNPGFVIQTLLHQLLDTADLLTCAVNDLRDEVPTLHSDASFTWNPWHGHGFHPADEELLNSLPPLPPQTPSFNYQQQAFQQLEEFPKNDETDNSFPEDQFQDTIDSGKIIIGIKEKQTNHQAKCYFLSHICPLKLILVILPPESYF